MDLPSIWRITIRECCGYILAGLGAIVILVLIVVVVIPTRAIRKLWSAS